MRARSLFGNSDEHECISRNCFVHALHFCGHVYEALHVGVLVLTMYRELSAVATDEFPANADLRDCGQSIFRKLSSSEVCDAHLFSEG